MHDTKAIIDAYEHCISHHQQCAIATVMEVEGPAYRKPGARLLIREDGTTVGGVSAGCLENDVIEYALLTLRTHRSLLVTYDTHSTGEEGAWDLPLGCGGMVRILIEPLYESSSYIHLLKQSLATANGTTISTLVQCLDMRGRGYAAVRRWQVTSDQARAGAEHARNDRAAMLASPSSVLEELGHLGDQAAPKYTKIYREHLFPPFRLVIFGAGKDVIPVVALSNSLGWCTEVVDFQMRSSTLEQFPLANKCYLIRPDAIASHILIYPRTVALVMTHNFLHDRAALAYLLNSPGSYIGVLGPRQRTHRMLNDLMVNDREMCHVIENSFDRVYAPAGLDIGSDSPTAIAVAIVAEIQCVLKSRNGGSLRDHNTSEHYHRRANVTDDNTLSAHDTVS